MKAAVIHHTGPPENIHLEDLPIPQPGPGQALVRVTTAAVNPIDTYLRSGAVPAPLPMPYIVGCDLAGEVVELGPEVDTSLAEILTPGQRVWASNQGVAGRQGTCAEYAVVDAEYLYPTPDEVSDTTAAATALVGLTSNLGLVSHAKLRSGERLFIPGGTGGIGSMVVQMARLLGAHVATTASNDEKLARCREYGAELALNYRTDDVATRLQEWASEGIDLWWETLREPNFDQTIDLLAPRGRMIVMAGRNARPQFPVGPFYAKQCRLLGLLIFANPPEIQRSAAEAISAWLASDELTVPIGATFSLDQVAQAHRLQEDNTLHGAGTLTGKIVIEMG